FARSAASSPADRVMIAPAVTNTDDVMQWWPAHDPSALWAPTSQPPTRSFQVVQPSPPSLASVSEIIWYDSISSPPNDPKPIAIRPSASAAIAALASWA